MNASSALRLGSNAVDPVNCSTDESCESISAVDCAALTGVIATEIPTFRLK